MVGVEQLVHGPAYLLLGHRHPPVHQAAADVEGGAARLDSAGGGVRERVPALHVDNFSRFDRLVHDGRVERQAADDVHFRLDALEEGGDPAYHAAATDRHEDGVELRQVGQNFLGDRALPLYDVVIGVRRYEDHFVVVGKTASFHFGLHAVRAVLFERDVIQPEGFLFGRVDVFGDENDTLLLEGGEGEGGAHSMVARGRGDKSLGVPPVTSVFFQVGEQLVEGTANFERACKYN